MRGGPSATVASAGCTGTGARSRRQQHRAGEKAFIDYCGPTVAVVDRHTGEIRNAQVFVGVLGASSYTYAEATYGGPRCQDHWKRKIS